MVDTPSVRYAQSGDIDIAYHVVGEGSPDLVFVMGAITHLSLLWEEPSYRRFCERLASFSRLIQFDKRGMGLSDRVRAATLEERMDDVRAVMDAAGSDRAALIGVSEGGPMSMLFAATYPERTAGLILCGAEVKEETTDDWPWGEATREEFEEWIAGLPQRWGTGVTIEWVLPSRKDDERLRQWFGRMLTEAASPRAAEAFMRMAFEIDVRAVVPSVNVPTLIVHTTGDRVCHVENARWLAEQIPTARYVEQPGVDHVPWGQNSEQILGEIQEFLTGTREAAEPERVLATVLFTDIVGSTTGPRSSETGAGGSCWSSITTESGASSPAIAVARSTPQATASSPASTARRARSAARPRPGTQSGSSGSSSAVASTPASARSSTGGSAGSPSTSVRGSRPRPAPATSSSHRPSAIS